MALAEAPHPTSAVWGLAQTVDAVLAEDSSQRPVADLADELVECRRQIDRLEAAFADRLRHFELRRGHVAQGATSVVAWMRHRCRMSSEAASVRAGVARFLPAVDGAHGAFRQGEIGLSHATDIAQAAGDVGASALAAVSDVVIEAAKQFDADRFRTFISHMRHSLDASGELSEANALHARRYLRLSSSPGRMCMVEGRMDPEAGAILRSALDPLCRPTPGDQRSAAARRADALVELARRQLDGTGALPARGGERPQLVVTATLHTLAGIEGAPAGQLRSGGTVPAATVRRIACDAAIRVDSALQIDRDHVDWANRRVVPPRLRRALILRDGGCRFPSCDRPPEWTDAHHIIHWIEGGKTRLDNLVTLCRAHHRFVHEDGWRIWLNADGSIGVRPP